MWKRLKRIEDLSMEELDRELIALGAKDFKRHDFNLGGPQRNEDQKAVLEGLQKLYAHSPKSRYNFTIYEVANELARRNSRRFFDPHRALWGLDDRWDFYMLKDEQIIENARSVAAILNERNLKPGDNDTYIMDTRKYRKMYHLCEKEPFRDQPVGAGKVCTGFLVAKDIIATAAHCLRGQSLESLRFVFGYRMKGYDQPITQFPARDVYRGIDIVDREYDRFNQDWALVKLDREVTGRTPIKLADNLVDSGQPVYVLGYPCGLPLKYGFDAQTSEVKEQLFSANLDIYMGNSGSPVICAKTHQVVGVLIHGFPQDFRVVGGTLMSLVYPTNHRAKSTKPHCIPSTVFNRFIPRNGV